METFRAQTCATEHRVLGHITLRYWASARAEAGVETDVVEVFGAVSLSGLRDHALGLHPLADRLPAVLAVCSVLVDDEPVSSRDPGEVLVAPGSTVEFLPPFAGG